MRSVPAAGIAALVLSLTLSLSVAWDDAVRAAEWIPAGFDGEVTVSKWFRVLENEFHGVLARGLRGCRVVQPDDPAVAFRRVVDIAPVLFGRGDAVAVDVRLDFDDIAPAFDVGFRRVAALLVDPAGLVGDPVPSRDRPVVAPTDDCSVDVSVGRVAILAGGGEAREESGCSYCACGLREGVAWNILHGTPGQ